MFGQIQSRTPGPATKATAPLRLAAKQAATREQGIRVRWQAHMCEGVDACMRGIVLLALREIVEAHPPFDRCTAQYNCDWCGLEVVRGCTHDRLRAWMSGAVVNVSPLQAEYMGRQKPARVQWVSGPNIRERQP